MYQNLDVTELGRFLGPAVVNMVLKLRVQ